MSRPAYVASAKQSIPGGGGRVQTAMPVPTVTEAGTIRRPVPDLAVSRVETIRRPVQTASPAPVQSRPPQRATDAAYDVRDRAPEDRLQNLCHRPSDDFGANVFDPYEPIVRGTLHVEGVNYAKYEAQKHRQNSVALVLDALRDDMISEVGNGVHREDILLNVYPGAIKTVVLHYDRDGDGERRALDPRLVDAEWSVKCDYAIRARDVQRQQNIAVALYTALGAESNFGCSRFTTAYMKTIDPNVDGSKIAVLRPVLEEGQKQPPQAQPPIPAPAAPRHRVYPSPARAIPAPPPLAQPTYPQPVYPPPPYHPAPVAYSQPTPTYPQPAAPLPYAANTPYATLAPQSPCAASPEVFQRSAPLQPPAMGTALAQGASLAHPSAVPVGEGWTEYKGRRGLAVFIPEDALSAQSKPAPSPFLP